MKFRKQISQNSKDKTPYWYLIIEKQEDIIEYAKMDRELFFNAFSSLQKDDGRVRLTHTTGRENMIAITIEAQLFRKPDDKSVYQLDIINNLVSEKAMAMNKVFNKFGPIQINHAGGYSDIEGFNKIWDVEILEEIEKDGIQFPIEKEPYKGDVLFLENGTSVDAEFINLVLDMCGYGEKNIIPNLKSIDPDFIIGSILNSPVIAFETELLDDIQIDKFIRIFRKMPRKKIIIKTPTPENITLKDQYPFVRFMHDIIFI